MKPSFEKLIPGSGVSFRCFERSGLTSPVKWHRHPEIELTYVRQGAGSRLVGDHIGTYSNHDLVLLGSDLPHTWLSDEFRGQPYDRHAAFVIQFHPDFLGPHFLSAPELSEISTLLKHAQRGLWFPPQIARSIGDLVEEMIDQSSISRLLRLLTTLQKLAEFPNPVVLATEGYLPPANAKIETRVQMICDHISQRLTDPELSHAELAKHVSMNASAFSRFFKQATGRSVSDYINELRVALVCRKLIDTNDSVLDICNQAGFNNVSSFNRLFRSQLGMTPRQYRKTHLAVAEEKGR